MAGLQGSHEAVYIGAHCTLLPTAESPIADSQPVGCRDKRRVSRGFRIPGTRSAWERTTRMTSNEDDCDERMAAGRTG